MRIKKKDMVNAVGRRLREIRTMLHLNKTEMATRLGLSQPAYCKKENGETLPGIFTQLHLQQTLDISMDWLLLGKGPMFYREKHVLGEELRAKLNNLKKELPEVLDLLNTIP